VATSNFGSLQMSNVAHVLLETAQAGIRQQYIAYSDPQSIANGRASQFRLANSGCRVESGSNYTVACQNATAVSYDLQLHVLSNSFRNSGLEKC